MTWKEESGYYDRQPSSRSTYTYETEEQRERRIDEDSWKKASVHIPLYQEIISTYFSVQSLLDINETDDQKKYDFAKSLTFDDTNFKDRLKKYQRLDKITNEFIENLNKKMPRLDMREKIFNLFSNSTEKKLLGKKELFLSLSSKNSLAKMSSSLKTSFCDHLPQILLLSANAGYVEFTRFLLDKLPVSTASKYNKDTVFSEYKDHQSLIKNELHEYLDLPLKESPIDDMLKYFTNPEIDVLLYENFIFDLLKKNSFDLAIKCLSELINKMPLLHKAELTPEEIIFLNKLKKTLNNLHDSFITHGNKEALISFQKEFEKTKFEYLSKEEYETEVKTSKTYLSALKDIDDLYSEFIKIKNKTPNKPTIKLLEKCDEQLNSIMNNSTLNPYAKLFQMIGEIVNLNNKIRKEVGTSWFTSINFKSKTAKALKDELLTPWIEKIRYHTQNPLKPSYIKDKVFFARSEEKYPHDTTWQNGWEITTSILKFYHTYKPQQNWPPVLRTMATHDTGSTTSNITSALTAVQNETKSSVVTPQQQETKSFTPEQLVIFKINSSDDLNEKLKSLLDELNPEIKLSATRSEGELQSEYQKIYNHLQDIILDNLKPSKSFEEILSNLISTMNHSAHLFNSHKERLAPHSRSALAFYEKHHKKLKTAGRILNAMKSLLPPLSLDEPAQPAATSASSSTSSAVSTVVAFPEEPIITHQTQTIAATPPPTQTSQETITHSSATEQKQKHEEREARLNKFNRKK